MKSGRAERRPAFRTRPDVMLAGTFEDLKNGGALRHYSAGATAERGSPVARHLVAERSICVCCEITALVLRHD